jgi:hypothetical protein
VTEAVETPIFEVHLPDPPAPSKVERERRAFLRLLPELLKTHRGQYVAIHDEQMVDSGPERLELVLRVQARLKTGIYVRLVDTSERIERVSGPRNYPRSSAELVVEALHESVPKDNP